MFTKIRRMVLLFLAGSMILNLVACENGIAGSTESSQETESEKEIEITSATNILSLVWEEYEEVDTDGNMYNDRFDIMGGHFETAVMNMPAKYDLDKKNDLELMYCVPRTVIPMIDDAATMAHFMRTATFTAGVYHVTDEANVQTVVDGIKAQTLGNQWLGGFPDKHLILIVDKQYVISSFGTQEIVANFEKVLKDLFGDRIVIQVNENIR